MADTGMPPITVLSPADITRIRNQNNQKGQYKVVIQQFADSGEIYQIVDQLPYFKDKVASENLTLNGIVQSLKGNIEKHGKDKGWPNFTVAKAVPNGSETEHVFLINDDAHAADTTTDTTTDDE